MYLLKISQKKSRPRTKLTTFLLLAFTLFAFSFLAGGCATNRIQIANLETGFAVENSREGIRLLFSNIPPETTRMFINIQTFMGADKDNPNVNDFFSSFSDFRGSSLEQVKQSEIVYFPFVQSGHEYTVSVIFQNKYNDDITDWMHANIVPVSGIHLVNSPQLSLNDTNSAMMLSLEPVFSSDVTFAPQKSGFAVMVAVNCPERGSGTISIGEQHFPEGLSADGLTWTFEPRFANALKEDTYLESGSFPAFGNAYSIMIYDNIRWHVQIAATSEFTYYL